MTNALCCVCSGSVSPVKSAQRCRWLAVAEDTEGYQASQQRVTFPRVPFSSILLSTPRQPSSTPSLPPPPFYLFILNYTFQCPESRSLIMNNGCSSLFCAAGAVMQTGCTCSGRLHLRVICSLCCFKPKQPERLSLLQTFFLEGSVEKSRRHIRLFVGQSVFLFFAARSI